MDLSTLIAAKDGAKAIYEGIKTVVDLKEDAAVNERIQPLLAIATDVQLNILETLTVTEAAKRRVADLEAEVIALKEWGSEKSRYALYELGPGALVYHLKPELQGTDPVHYICPQCYQNNIKSILQAGLPKDLNRTLECHRCNLSVLYRPPGDESDEYIAIPGKGGAW